MHHQKRFFNGITVVGEGDGTYLKQKLVPFADCAEQDNFELPEDLDVVAHQQAVAAIAPAARALHDFWLSQR